MNRTTIFVILQACNGLTMVGSSLITPFFPPFAIEKGLSTTTLGFIISANPVGCFFTSLVVGKYISKSNRRTFIMVGLCLQGLGLYSFAALTWVNDVPWLIVFSTMGRLIGGVGTACFMTPFYAYIPLLYPNEVEKHIGISEFISGFAMLLGPVFGSLLYMAGGYTMPFLVFGSFDITIPILSLVFGEQKLAQTKFEESPALLIKSETTAVAPEQPVMIIGYLSALSQYPIIMQLMMVLACNICFTYFQPIIAEFYLQVYGINSAMVGYLMSIVTAGYAVGSFAVGHVKRNKRPMVCIGCVLFGITYLFVGPDKTLTGLDHHLTITLVSQVFMGIFTAPVYIPAVPILNEVLNWKYPGQNLQTANISSAGFTCGMSLGQLIGPIISGALNQAYGFDFACSILAFFLIALAILYIPMIFLEIPEGEPKTGSVGIKDNSKLTTQNSNQSQPKIQNEPQFQPKQQFSRQTDQPIMKTIQKTIYTLSPGSMVPLKMPLSVQELPPLSW